MANKDPSVQRENLFVTIKGKRIFWLAFINGLDDYKRSADLTSERVAMNYSRMIYPLQLLADDWHNGEKRVSLSRKMDATKFGYKDIKSDLIPAALEEMFELMEKELFIESEKLLKSCDALSEEMYQSYLDAQATEERRLDTVGKLANGCRKKLDIDAALADVAFLNKLERSKKDYAFYELDDNEVVATRLLSNLILLYYLEEKIPHWTLRSLVQNKFIEESDVSVLLKSKYQDKRSCVWYLDKLKDWGMEDDTLLDAEDVLRICLPNLLNVIGISRDRLHLEDI